MRERLHATASPFLPIRITPARAGKTYPILNNPSLRWDHPRSCGKDSCRAFSLLSIMGSPPLVRERLDCIPDFYPGRRITPARAGKTMRIQAVREQHWDHPRSCGKDLISTPTKGKGRGSPPLVRERLVELIKLGGEGGITPARAGKTLKYIPCRHEV